MKQVISNYKKTGLLALAIMALGFAFTGCTKSDTTVTADIAYALSGNSNGSQATPANNSSGSGNMTGTYHSATKVMTYTTTWSNLSGPPINGGLYIGISGQVGTSLYAWTLGSGLTANGTFSASTTLNADQEAQLLAGKCYYALGTTANASGEIRGQITATKQ